VLTRLEEWYDRGDEFGELTLGDEVLTHLEKWEIQDQGDESEDLAGPESRAERPRVSLPPPPDRAHRLWDRDLDG
jgi:hypothetical protein